MSIGVSTTTTTLLQKVADCGHSGGSADLLLSLLPSVVLRLEGGVVTVVLEKGLAELEQVRPVPVDFDVFWSGSHCRISVKIMMRVRRRLLLMYNGPQHKRTDGGLMLDAECSTNVLAKRRLQEPRFGHVNGTGRLVQHFSAALHGVLQDQLPVDVAGQRAVGSCR